MMDIPPDVSDAALRLGQLWHFYKLGYKGIRLVEEASGICHELLKLFTEAELEEEIKSKERRRTETTWEFEKRMRAKAALLESIPVKEDGELDEVAADWQEFKRAYIAEWPRFGADYSFLDDWKKQHPFTVATLEELMKGVQIVRANPKQAMSANKFALLAAAVRSVMRKPTHDLAVTKEQRERLEEAKKLINIHGYKKAMEILKSREKK